MSHHSRTKLDILITSDVKTLHIDLDPTSQSWTLQTTQSQCSTCWSRPHLGNSLPHLRLRQLSFFSSAAIRHNVHHRLPFDSSSPRESSGFFWFMYSCNSSSVVPRSAPLRLTSRCLHGPSHAACGLAGLAVVGAPLSSHPLRALHVEVVDIMSSAFRLSLGV